MPESVDWHELLRVWLHDPVDKALDIRSHEARAARYASRALGWDVTSREIRSSALPGDQLAAIAERLPMPTAGRRGERAVGLQDGKIAVRHPVSAQEDVLAGLALDENKVAETIDGIVASLPDDPRLRFLALWRLLPERLKGALARLPADTRVPDHTLIQHADIASGLWASHQSAQGGAYLSLSVGPVQSFIEAARSVRDLWSGSAMLSWLTFQGIRPVLEQLGPTALVYPALRGNPLMDMWLRDQVGLKNVVPLPSEQSRRSPSIPNRFVVLAPWGPDGIQAQSLADACCKAVNQAWYRLADDVQGCLDILSGIDRDWAHRWQAQVNSFFEVRTSVLSERDMNDETLARLIGSKDAFNDVWCDSAKVRGLADAIPQNERPGYNQQSAGRWQAQLELSARLMEAQRSIRHVPGTPQSAANENSPPKCSLFGSYEQMGPTGLDDSREFWQEAAKRVHRKGVRLRHHERFSAVALCKRFAAPATLAGELDLKPSDLRFPDTATVAAAEWLDKTGIDPDAVRREHHDWNGRWLHLRRRGEDKGEDPPPGQVWDRIKAAQKEKGLPPSYYAILAMDADNMGQWLKGDCAPKVCEVLHPKMVDYYKHLGEKAAAGLDAKRPVGPALHASISEALNNFASHIAPDIVEKHNGTMIYSGGDDVLALLSVCRAVECAVELRRAFRGSEDPNCAVPPGWTQGRDNRLWLAMGNKATLSAGIAFVHFMEDLRSALGEARRAEKEAKDSGRDWLTLRFIRRSGEHSEAGLAWECAPWFQEMVAIFAGGATDRWTYRLRRELPTLQGSNIPAAAVRAEIRRLVDRTTKDDEVALSGPSGREVEQWWQKFSTEGEKRGHSTTELLESFTLLCQGASFVARGQDG
jgi:CRISPR-associated protein Cmr2